MLLHLACARAIEAQWANGAHSNSSKTSVGSNQCKAFLQSIAAIHGKGNSALLLFVSSGWIGLSTTAPMQAIAAVRIAAMCAAGNSAVLWFVSKADAMCQQLINSPSAVVQPRNQVEVSGLCTFLG